MRDIPTSPRIVEIRRKRRARKIWIAIVFLLLFFLVIIGLSFLSSNKKMQIDNITVEGNHIIDIEEIQNEIYKNISGRYIHLFSRNNSLIYPHKRVYNNLLLNFPRIESLSIKRENFKTLHINIIERIGTFLYCGADVPVNKEDVGENCYFINNDGLIFDQAPYFSGNIYFKYYVKLSDEANPLGRQMISSEDFHKITRFIDSIESLGLKPIYIYIGQDGTNSLYLEHQENNTLPKILFKNDANLEVLQDNFSLAMQKKEFADEIHSKYNTLLYIDLRFKNKVLYKFSAQGGSVSGGQ